MTIEASAQTKKTDDVLERFTDFCRRRSRRQMSEKTLVRYVQVIDTLNSRHGLSLEAADIVQVEQVITERVSGPMFDSGSQQPGRPQALLDRIIFSAFIICLVHIELRIE